MTFDHAAARGYDGVVLKVISAPELARNLDPILQALEESGTTLIIKHHDQPAALLVRFDAYVAMLATMDYSGWERWIEEVRAAGVISETASKMIGLREIRELLEGKMSILQCVAQIQQATRQYAKRQLTWFRHQTNFEPLNLSLLSHGETVKWISQRARRAFAEQG